MENKTQYKVVGIFGGPKHEHVLGTFDNRAEAMEQVRNLTHESDYRNTSFDEVLIVKVSEEVVLRPSQFEHKGERRSFHPDYERQGVQTVTADFEKLRDTVYHLEDRHVGLRHELSTDMEMLEDSLEELKDNLAEDLRDLRMELEEMRGRTQR